MYIVSFYANNRALAPFHGKKISDFIVNVNNYLTTGGATDIKLTKDGTIQYSISYDKYTITVYKFNDSGIGVFDPEITSELFEILSKRGNNA